MEGLSNFFQNILAVHLEKTMTKGEEITEKELMFLMFAHSPLLVGHTHVNPGAFQTGSSFSFPREVANVY